MDDYPNPSDAWRPEIPKERKEAEQKEQVNVTTSIGVIQDVLDWFDQQIAEYGSPKVIAGVNASTPSDDVKFAVLLTQKIGADYEAKAHAFRTKFAKHLKEKADDA